LTFELIIVSIGILHPVGIRAHYELRNSSLGAERVEMNAQKTGALDSPLRAEGSVFSFLV